MELRDSTAAILNEQGADSTVSARRGSGDAAMGSQFMPRASPRAGLGGDAAGGMSMTVAGAGAIASRPGSKRVLAPSGGSATNLSIGK